VKVDSNHNVYVANWYGNEPAPSITVYAPPSSGNVPPTYAISDYQYGSPPQWGLLGAVHGIALDSSDNIYVSADRTTASILEYAAGSNGAAIPSRAIAGSSTDLSGAGGVAVDKNGNIWCYCGYGNPGGAILKFSSSASGDVAPIVEIQGPNTMLLGGNGGGGLALDKAGNIYVTVGETSQSGPPGVLVFKKNAHGNVTPSRVIAGSNTQLVYPIGIALDSKDNVYVADDHAGPSGGGSINVFSRGANGNVAPIRTITGSATQLSTTIGIAVH
jgi:hypothetical protein